jgi:hypothetical protein
MVNSALVVHELIRLGGKMTRFGIFLGCITIAATIILPQSFAATGNQTTNLDGPVGGCLDTLNNAPYVTTAADFSISLCQPEMLCVSGTADDLDFDIQDVFVNYGYYDDAADQICFYADTSGSYMLILTAVDTCGAFDSDTTIVTVDVSQTPQVDLGNDFNVSWSRSATACVDVALSGTYQSVVTNLGDYNEQTRQVCFTPDTSGIYSLVVEAVNTCGESDADTVNITVASNNPPVVTGMPDTSLYLCYPQEICLPVEIYDPDGDIDSVTVNRGSLQNDSVCFVPYDSGHYQIIVTAYDSFGNVGADTAMVIITTDQGVSIICPNDTTIFTCTQVDTFAFPLYGVPENGQVTVTGINTWYDTLTDSIYFWSECSNNNQITVTVTTECNTYTCSFTATIVCNSPPLVILPPDTSFPSCGVVDICLPVGIRDLDGNLADIFVQGATYDPATDRVCFTADTTGVYAITVTAVDSCGASDSDMILVTVTADNPPTITSNLTDSIFTQCVPEEICLPVTVDDSDNNLDTVISSLGFYDNSTGQLCFTPDTAGQYCVQLVAVDECGLADSAEICVTVLAGDSVKITCPEAPIDVGLCQADQICWPLEITGADFQVQTSYGTWQNGELCFFADTSGVYTIEVIGDAPCNSDTCYVTFAVTLDEPVAVTCPPDTTVVVCGADTLNFDFTVSSTVNTVSVSPPAYVVGQQVYVPVLQPGQQTITMIASGDCGADTCSFTVNAQFNSPPALDAGNDTTLTICDFTEVCLPFTASDPDNNIVDISSSIGTVQDGKVCFTPDALTTYQVIITTTDACNEVAVDTVNVTIKSGGVVAIICPEGIHKDTLCGPDTIRISAPITPDNAQVTVLPNGYYDPATGNIFIGIDQPGVYDVTVIAEAFCGSDTCTFTLDVTFADPPSISAPGQVSETVCLTAPTTVCYPVTISGTDVAVTVGPIGVYDNGQVCIPVDTAGVYDIEIIAANACGADTSYTTVEIMEDQPPGLNLPAYQVFERCPEDADTICIDGIFATDAETIPSLSMTCGVGTFEFISLDSGRICFVPDTFGVYEFCFEASDTCNMVSGSFFVEIVEKEDCDVCTWLSIDGGECVPVGASKNVDLLIETKVPIGGFDILLNFDPTAVQFVSATISGTSIEGWELFEYRLDPTDPSLLKLIGIADIANGPIHPPESTLTPNGVLVRLNFLVKNDQNLGGLFLPINFTWIDCGDNTLSDELGEGLYMDLRIYNPETTLVWDEMDDVNYPESSRPIGLGAPDICLDNGGTGKPSPTRCIEFLNGGICVIPAESLDVRGDINLNGIPYEIADAVLFTNYFIYGISVFRINVAGQTAATDVNADGITLSIADLVYLIRVIIGDADPNPKLSPYPDELIVSTNQNTDGTTIVTDAAGDIGAAYFVYNIGNDLTIDEVRLAPDAAAMDLQYAVNDGQLRILLYNVGTNKIKAGLRELVTIQHSGDGSLELAHAEIVDYQGRPYAIAGQSAQLPTGFMLHQNYPNPFNPATTISFSLPRPAEWDLQIFNLTGSLVREYHGSSEAGTVEVEWNGTASDGTPVASGIYFYRLKAADFVDTKKMVLLK